LTDGTKRGEEQEVMIISQALPSSLPPLGGHLYNLWKTELLSAELFIGRTLSFHLYPSASDHPHRHLPVLCEVLQREKGMPASDGNKNTTDDTKTEADPLVQLAWNILNDSMRGDFVVRTRSEVVACAAWYIAARRLAIALPQPSSSSSSTTHPHVGWWQVLGVELEELLVAAEAMVVVLKLQPVKMNAWLPPVMAIPFLEETKRAFGLTNNTPAYLVEVAMDVMQRRRQKEEEAAKEEEEEEERGKDKKKKKEKKKKKDKHKKKHKKHKKKRGDASSDEESV
jgi:hypothetical protein